MIMLECMTYRKSLLDSKVRDQELESIEENLRHVQNTKIAECVQGRLIYRSNPA